MKLIDVTEKVRFGYPDDEALPLNQCVCGKTWDYWDNIISMYEEDAIPCDCGRRLIFNQRVTVYEVIEDEAI